MLFFRLLAALFAAGALTACATDGPLGALPGPAGPTSSVQIVANESLPNPSLANIVVDALPNRIGAYDVLDIGVFGIDGLERREVRVDGAGRISFPLAGSVDALGMTPMELEQRIAQNLRAAYVRDPKVSVNLREQTSQTFTVSGQVREPGNFPYRTRMTLIRAVAQAKGLDEFAKTDEVIILRNVGGRQLAGIYDIRGIERGNYDDPAIYPSDIVVVGDSAQRRLIRNVIGIAPALLAPIIVTLGQ